MLFQFILCALATLRAVECTCGNPLPVYKVFNSTNRVLTLDDEAGARDIKVTTYAINACQSESSIETGSQESQNGTWLSHVNNPTGSACLQMVVSSYRVYVSFQAIVIRSNGWSLKPSFVLDDISAEVGATSTFGWKESIAVFGIKNKALVSPNISLSEDTLLRSYKYIVPSWASRNMGLEIGAVMATGAEYAHAQYQNCSAAVTACQAKVTFSEYVDAFVVMFALAQRATTLSTSTATMSSLNMGCDCRCRVVNMGPRMITSAAPESNSSCVRKESTSPVTECDVFGNKWCSKDPSIYYEITGAKKTSGLFPCVARNNYVAKYLDEFLPVSPF